VGLAGGCEGEDADEDKVMNDLILDGFLHSE
jgi:hypothetical protein